MMDLVSVVIVNWNGEKYLDKCIESLLNQDYPNLEIIMIDNASTDNSVKLVKEKFGDKVRIIENENTGYSGGANKGIDSSSGEYVVIANPDVVFGAEYVRLCVEKLKLSDENAAATGKLLKYDFDKDEIIEVIDSVGIQVNHKRQARDIAQNDVDNGKYEKDRRVFGVSGAAAIFKRESLEKIKINGEYFDLDFFAYKEDVDLCWRLNLYGFKCYYVHNAVAYHGRAMNSSKGILNTIKNRRNQSEFLKGISFRNHYLMLIKNEVLYTYKKDKLSIYIDLIKYLAFFVLFDFRCLKYIKEIKNMKSKMVPKREEIRANIKLKDEEIYELFNL